MQSLRKIVKIALWCTVGLVSIVALMGAGLALRLASGPIDTSVPQSLLDRVVAEAAPGWHVAAGGAQLDFSSDDGLNGLKLRNVILTDSNGKQVVSTPLLGLRFALSASMTPTEMLTVREVALSGAAVDVTRDKDGAFQLALGNLTSGRDEASDPFASLSELGALGDLPRLRIEDARVRYTDLARGSTWRTENARLTLTPTAKGVSGTLGLMVDGGIGGAQLDAFHVAETGEVSATLTLSDVRPSRVAELDPLLLPLARIDAPLSGAMTMIADDGGTIRTIDASLRASNGTLLLGGDTIALSSFAADIACDFSEEECQIDGLSIQSSELNATARGSLRRDGSDEFLASLTIENATARQEDTLGSVASSTIEARFVRSTGEMIVENAHLTDVAIGGLPNGLSVTASSIESAASYDPETGSLKLPSLGANDINVTDARGVRQSLESLQAKIDVELETRQLSFKDVVARTLSFGDGANLITVEHLDSSGAVDLAEKRVAIDALLLTGTRVSPAGQKPSTFAAVNLSGNVDIELQSLKDGKIDVAGAVLSLPDLYVAPVQIANAKMTLDIAKTDDVTRLSVKSANAVIDGLPAEAKGQFAVRSNGSTVGRIEASLGPVALARVPRHWPLGVAPGGLRWVASNVAAGTADSLVVKAQFDEAMPENDTLDLRFGFRDASVSFAPGMPPIENAVGSGHVTLDRFDLLLSEGTVAPPQASRLRLDGSRFSIADFSPKVPVGEVQVHVQGGVQSVLRLLDNEPLGVISPTGFDISTAKGEADVRVLLELPLAEDLRVDDVRFDARAKVRDYSLREPQTDMPVSGDLLQVKATPKGLSLQSDARIGGLSARLGYAQGFDKPEIGEPDSILTLESFLSLGDFARHGIILDDHVEGLTAMKARVEMFDGGAARINADADLTNVSLKADRVGWSKPAGVPATVRISGFRNPDGAGRIEALALRGEGLSADGSIGFGPDGEIGRANFSRIVLGSAVDTGLIYGRKTDGSVGILLKGAQLDLRRAFADALAGDGGTNGTDRTGGEVDISVQMGRVFLRDDLGVFDLKGGIRLRGGALHAANVAGKLNGSAPAKLLAERRKDGIAIRLTSADAGAFIRATDIFTGAYDGALTLDAITRDSQGPSQISGRILVNDMVVHDAPTLGRILSGGAIGSLLGDLADGGIAFSKIELPFRGVGPRWQIEDGVAYGPQIGLTLEGGYDVARSQLALNGSVSPAYAINGALGNVPLLGSILTGGEGEGVFGVTFSVDGDTDQPIVNVNPLSALAPGFLRKIVAEVGKGRSDGSPSSRPVTNDR